MDRPRRTKLKPYRPRVSHPPLPIIARSQQPTAAGDGPAAIADNDPPATLEPLHGVFVGFGVHVRQAVAEKLYREGFFGKGEFSRGAADGIRFAPPPPAQPLLTTDAAAEATQSLPGFSNADTAAENRDSTRGQAVGLAGGSQAEACREDGAAEQQADKAGGSDTLEDARGATETTAAVEGDGCGTSGAGPRGEGMESMAGEETAVATAVETTAETETGERHILGLDEAFFLAYGLGCLLVFADDDASTAMSLDELWGGCCGFDPLFPVRYFAYHHYRAKGWVAKCGIKYGCDFVLYEKGPVFSHASFCAVVRVTDHTLERPSALFTSSPSAAPAESELTWTSVSAVQRLAEQVAKDTVLCFVVVPEGMTSRDLLSPACLDRFAIQECVLRRWRPASAGQVVAKWKSGQWG